MDEGSVLLELGAVVVALGVLARIAGRLGVPSIPLFLAAGLAFGEGGVLPLGASEEFIRIGAEIGLVVLLFMLGLEYSSRDLLQTFGESRRAGLIDLVLNFTPGFATGLILGWGALPATFLGGATYVTSSGIAARLLEQINTTSRDRRTILSILVLEDLTMAVFFPLLGAFLIGGGALRGAVTAIGALAGVTLVLMIGLRVETGISRIVFGQSDEALLLSILGFGIVVAGAAEQVQVSAAVGALLAGILLSGPATRAAQSLLSPVRDLFAAIFFGFIGLSVDPRALSSVAPEAAALGLVTLISKFFTARFSMDKSSARTRLLPGAILAARGEFSLAIAGLAVAARVEPSPAPLIAAYVILMAIVSPLLAKALERSPATSSRERV